MLRIVVLRWGHRARDYRLTSHVALTARAMGASGVILTDVKDENIRRTVKKIVELWGGPFFFEDGIPWSEAVRKWKVENGVVVHLTVYGENIEDGVIKRIKSLQKDVMVIVGSRKVPSVFFSEKVSDFNVAVGNQPHSECASLAVFLDRYFEGKELKKEFENAKIKVNPMVRGKSVIKLL